jgi:Cu2+-containing amine oxidase
MSSEIVATSPAPRTATSVPAHPLAPLSAAELTQAAAIIKASWPAHTDLHFKVVTLEEPPKSEVLAYLDAEHSHRPLPTISRRAFLNYYIRNTVSTSPVIKFALSLHRRRRLEASGLLAAVMALTTVIRTNFTRHSLTSQADAYYTMSFWGNSYMQMVMATKLSLSRRPRSKTMV